MQMPAIQAFPPIAPARIAQLAEVRDFDLRLAAIGFRLATSNAALCHDLEPGTGVHLHSSDQYVGAIRDDAIRFFGLHTPVAVMGIIPGGPAFGLGLNADDPMIRIAGVEVSSLASDGEPTTLINAVHDRMALLPPSAPISFATVREGREVEISLTPEPACRSRFEVTFENGFHARADGRMVQISAAFLQRYSDDELAVVVAHELAHNVMRHRIRLDGAGVDRGLLSGFGRNVRYFRQVEVEADLIGIHLLANAGYDPRSAVSFWRKHEGTGGAGMFTSRTHPSWKKRAARLEAEADRIAASTARPLVPELLAARNMPLDGDWQSLLEAR